MHEFLSIELPYIVISVFILGVVLFVGSRSFISPMVIRRGLPGIAIFLILAIFAHYFVTINRIAEVVASFENGKTILCSERRSKLGDRSIEVRKGDIWHIEDGHFVNLENDRFSIGQCLVK